jgi:hypothetical protein
MLHADSLITDLGYLKANSEKLPFNMVSKKHYYFISIGYLSNSVVKVHILGHNSKSSSSL